MDRRTPWKRAARLLALAALVVLSLAPSPALAQSTFVDEPVAAVPAPTGIAFTPDGRILVTTQPGQLRVIQGGMLLPTPALDLSSRLCANSERGLLGVAVDPAFSANRAIYLYWTFAKHGVCPTLSPQVPVNRVSRFVLPDSNVIDPGSETVLIDNIPSYGGNHNGGDLAFSPAEGYLYASVGDGGCDYAGGGCAGANDAARDRHHLLGKVLRIRPDGATPSDNPFASIGTPCAAVGVAAPGTICSETWGWGLRNPFRIAFDPTAGYPRLFINDVGQNTWEEVDLGEAGADYGWNVREGPCVTGSTTNCGPPPAGMRNPIHAYPHSSGCRTITGGAFAPAGWPYAGDYLYADYICGMIFRLQRTASGYVRTTFASGLGSFSVVDLAFGPPAAGQALYYATYAGGGQLRRFRYVSGAPVPAETEPVAEPLPPPPPPPPPEVCVGRFCS